MPKIKEKREPIKFEENTPVQVTFDYEPSTAKGYEQERKFSDSGKVTKYAVSVNGKQIIFATEALYAKIKGYQKGDTVSVNFAEKRWIVNPINVSDGGVEKLVNDTESNIILRKIASDIEEIKQHLYGSKETIKNYPTDEEEL